MARDRRRVASVLLLGAGVLLGSGCGSYHGYGYGHGYYGHGYGHYGHGYHASYHGGGDGLVVIAAVVALWYLLGDACGW